MNQQTCRVYILLQYYPISSLAMGIVLPYEEKQIRSWIFMVLFLAYSWPVLMCSSELIRQYISKIYTLKVW